MHPSGDPIFLSHPIARKGLVTEVSAQALACVRASQRSLVQGRVTQACLHAAVGEKSESASLCLQGLGAAGIPSLLISQPELFIHSFLAEGYIYVVLFKWISATFAHSSS